MACSCIVGIGWKLFHFYIGSQYLFLMCHIIWQILLLNSGSRLNLRSFISADSVLIKLSRYDLWCVTVLFVCGSESSVHLDWSFWASNCIMVPVLLICSHSTHSTSPAFTVHTFHNNFSSYSFVVVPWLWYQSLCILNHFLLELYLSSACCQYI